MFFLKTISISGNLIARKKASPPLPLDENYHSLQAYSPDVHLRKKSLKQNQSA